MRALMVFHSACYRDEDAVKNDRRTASSMVLHDHLRTVRVMRREQEERWRRAARQRIRETLALRRAAAAAEEEEQRRAA
jgi:hypothetical protein